MKKTRRSWIIFMFLFVMTAEIAIAAEGRISVVYDSETHPGSGMKTGWGWSAVIERGDFVVMLDTGWDDAIFRHNLKKSGYKPTDIDVVVISHWHPDHIGGLEFLMEANPGLIAYVPGSSSHRVPDSKRYFVPEGKKNLKVGIMIIQTVGADFGQSGVEDELSIVVKTAAGAAVIHGCAHSELRNILRNVKDILPGRIHLTMGGMRYLQKTEDEMRVIAKDLKMIGLEKIGPAHCAVGPASTKIFKEYFGKNVFNARLGAVIPLPSE